ncbi:WXG100 family type VII secretion target [Nocardia sp. NPDC058519]|uniref:WXG100 family type VII secretion target n=1 Tax=Nocardia sp. NPDC058519 TaxID=3346535 RepID=UPI00366943D3
MSTVGKSEQEAAMAGVTSLTPAQVLAWEPATLTARGDAWASQAQKLTVFDDTQYRAVDGSRDYWTGSAAEAMRTEHEQMRTTAKTFIAALEDGATAAQSGASRLDSAKTAVVNAVKSAESNGYEVGDDGTVKISTSTHRTLLSQLPDASSYTTAAGALQVGADASTTAVRQALENARTSASSVEAAIEKAFSGLPDGDPAILTEVAPSPSSESQEKYGAEAAELISKSPTLKSQLDWLAKEGVAVSFGEPGAGSYTQYNGDNKSIVLDGNLKNNPQALVQTLAHEAGHAGYTGSLSGATVEDCVNARLTNEGAATLNNMVVQREILSNGGSDIGVAGYNDVVGPTWDQSLKDYTSAGWTPAAYQKAIHQIGQSYGDNLHPSTAPNMTYREYYTQQCK